MIEYWKRRYVPEKCPECGAGPAVFIEGPMSDKVAFGMLKMIYTSWGAVLKKHPRWKIPCWFGTCGICTFKVMLTDRNPIFDFLGMSEEYSGGYIPIPLEISK